MANKLMTKSEANEYCRQNGYKLFIDMCIKENIIVENDPYINLLYNYHFENTWGTIELKIINKELELWIGGERRFSIHVDNI